MDIKSIKKICIIGGAGTGKTSLSNEIGKELNLPIYHIDGIHFKENWLERDESERDKIILDIMKKDSWIFDGTYRSTLLDRLIACDLVIYLDYPTSTQVISSLKRYIKTRGKEKEDIPGCKEKMDLDFFKYVIQFRKISRPHVIERLNKTDSNKVIVFKSRKELYKWFYKTFNKRYRFDK